MGRVDDRNNRLLSLADCGHPRRKRSGDSVSELVVVVDDPGYFLHCENGFMVGFLGVGEAIEKKRWSIMLY